MRCFQEEKGLFDRLVGQIKLESSMKGLCQVIGQAWTFDLGVVGPIKGNPFPLVLMGEFLSSFGWEIIICNFIGNYLIFLMTIDTTFCCSLGLDCLHFIML